MEKRLIKLSKVVGEKKSKEEVGLPTEKMDSVRHPSPATNISEDRKAEQKAQSLLKSSDKSDMRLYKSYYWSGKSKRHQRRRHYRLPLPDICK